MVRKIQNVQQSTKTFLKSGVCSRSRDNLRTSYVIRNSNVRLCGGKDHIWIPPSLDSSIIDVTSVKRHCPEKFYHPVKGFMENSVEIEKMINKYDLSQPIEIDVSNITQTQNMPSKLQRLIVPRNNEKLNCYIPRNTSNLPNIPIMRKTVNARKILGSSKKKKPQSQFLRVLSRRRNSLDQTSFENISKFSILLLYLHFLLCYYLSFSKTQQFVELFEMCPVQDSEN